MRRMPTVSLVMVLVTGALAASYWLGSQKDETSKTDFVASGRADSGKKPERKILYYRNPMGLPDTSPVPKKDQMGMDYIPVYEGEEPETAGPGLKISLDKVQKLGVKTELATLRSVSRTVRAVGTVEFDERQIYTVAPKFEGWIERLHVNTTGQYVRRGQALMEVYSPDLVTAQQEYLIALKGMESVREASADTQANMGQLVKSALERLRNWDISDEEMARLQKEGVSRRTLTLRSPVSGVVLDKPALKGMRFMPGEALYKISDMSSVWLLADIFEQDLGLIQANQSARISVNAYPGKTFSGKVAFVYPTVTSETRTAKVRIELSNPGGQLKQGMYASVELIAGRLGDKRLAVPDSAVLDSGTRQIVLVQRGEGLFEPRPVKLGTYSDGYVEVLEGISAGDNVVTSANFLIDSESNLKAALGTFGTAEQKPSTPQGAPAAAGETHKGDGTVRNMDLKTGSINIEHGPIASLKWPAMTMEFKVKDKALVKGVKPGDSVEFELVQQGPGEFLITRITPATARATQGAAGAVQDHKGH